MTINWGLLGPPVDIGAAVRQGYETGRAMAIRGRRERAVSALAANPSDKQAMSALAAIDPETAWKFDDRARADRTREAVSRVLGPQPSALGPVNVPAEAVGGPLGAAQPTSATIPPPAPVGAVAASPAPDYDMAALRQLYAEDPDTAKSVLAFIQASTKEQREAVAAKYSIAVPLLMEAQRLPLEQRKAFILQQASDLMAQGWTMEELQGFDPTDANIRGQIAIGTPLKDMAKPTAMQQNYEFLTGIDQSLGRKYLERQTDQPPMIASNGDGTFTIIPRSQGGGMQEGPPAAAIEHLRQHPELRADFDAKYGQGAAARALEGGAGPSGPQTFP